MNWLERELEDAAAEVFCWTPGMREGMSDAISGAPHVANIRDASTRVLRLALGKLENRAAPLRAELKRRGLKP